MKTATGLVLIALGAVLAFAVHGHPWFLNIQVVGWIIMIVGVVGIAIPRSGYGWLRRQVVTRRTPDGGRRVVGIRQKRYPPYIMINPAAATADADAVAAQPPATEAVIGEPVEQTREMPEMPTDSPARSWDHAEQVVPDEEVVEEYFQE
jgi:hypothetical protein